jgi:hypothetical protein
MDTKETDETETPAPCPTVTWPMAISRSVGWLVFAFCFWVFIYYTSKP